MDITYTLTLTVTRAVDCGTYDQTPDELRDLAEWMQSAEANRELEKQVLHHLRKLEGDCDVEVVDRWVERTDEEERDITSTGWDTWEEWRGEK